MSANRSETPPYRNQGSTRSATESQPRAELTELASAFADTRLVLVRAPAGSGKTTLLRAWRQRLAPVVWFDTTPAVDDPVLFLDQFIAAFRTVVPSFGEATERALFNYAERSPDRQALFRAWQRDASRLTEPLFCFIDDFHVLDSASEGARLVDDIVRYAPASLHFIIASRGSIPTVVSRLRLDGSVVEVTFDDLSLNSGEIGEVLRSRGVMPDPELIAVILASTSGWATGVVVTANTLAPIDPEARTGQARVIARHPDLFAYGANELLREAPGDLITLLEILAIVGRIDEPVLALLATDRSLMPYVVTDGIESARIPSRISRAIELGLLAREGSTVLLPSIWQNLLKERLRERLTESSWTQLHSNLGRLLARHGQHTGALNAFFESEEWSLAADTLAQQGFDWIKDGRHRYVEALLSRLPESLRQANGRLVHLAGLCRSRGRPGEAIDILEEAVRLYRRAGDRNGEYDALRMIGLLCFGQARWDQLSQAITRAISVANLLTNKVVRNELVATFGAKAFLSGRYGLAIKICNLAARGQLGLVERWSTEKIRMSISSLRGEWERVLHIGDVSLEDPLIRSYPPAYHSLVPHRALAQAHLGQFDQALSANAESAAILGEENHSRLQAHAFLVESQIYIAAGALNKASASTARSLAAYEVLDDLTGIAPACAILANLHWLLGDAGKAAELAERCATTYERLPAIPADSLPWLIASVIRLLARTGDLSRASHLLDRFRREIDHPDLPYVHFTGLLWLADTHDALGNRAVAERLWQEAWQYGAKHRVTKFYLPLDAAALTRSGLAGVRSGSATDYLYDRIRSVDPTALSALLVDLIADSASSVRIRALELIGRLGDPSSYPAVRAATKDPDSGVRRAADAALSRIDLRPRYRLNIRTLGRFEVSRGDQVILEREWRGLMAKRLLFRLLIASGRAVPRETIQLDLWPDADLEAAQHNLRVTLNRLNDILEPDRPAGAPTTFVIATNEALSFNTKSDHHWDVAVWLSEADQADLADHAGDVRRSVNLQQQAIDQYGGQLVPELRDDSWVVPLRTRIEDRFLSLCLRLAQQLLTIGSPEAAAIVADRLTQLEPTEESGWILLIRSQLAAGDRVAARRSYRRAVQAIRSTLEVEPSAELSALLAALD